MNVLYLTAALGLVAAACGLPKPQSLVPGVFIPADAFKNLQDRANANDRNSDQGYQPNTNSQNSQPIGNQGYQPNTNPQNSHPIGNQGYQPNTNPQNSQPIGNQGYQPNTNPQNSQPIGNQGYQPNTNPQNSQPIGNQGYQPITNPQNNLPTGYPTNVLNSQLLPNQGSLPNTNLPMYNSVYPQGTPVQGQPGYQPVITARTPQGINQLGNNNQLPGTSSNVPTVLTMNPANVLPLNQPNVIPLNQPNTLPMNPGNVFPLNQQPQPGQGIIYVQQQLPNQQTVFIPQSNQPVVFGQQPNQGVMVQNPQISQPTKVIFSNPSQGQNSNPVYTLIPLNGPNQSSTGGSYLVPIQSGGSPIMISSGK